MVLVRSAHIHRQPTCSPRERTRENRRCRCGRAPKYQDGRPKISLRAGASAGGYDGGRDPSREQECACPPPTHPIRSSRTERGHAWRSSAPGLAPSRRARCRPPSPAPSCRRSRSSGPANPEHGDFATNLAMKLARPYRMAPLRIAEALAAELATRGRAPGSPIASVEVAPPGFLNLRLADGALEELVAGILANPGAWGRVTRRPPSTRQRRVRVGQPDRAAPHRQRPRRVRRRPALPRPRGGRPRGDARVLLQRLRGAGPQPRRVGRRDPPRRPVPEDGYHGDYVGDLAAELPDEVWRGGAAEARAPTRPWSSGTGPRSASAPASKPRWPPSASTSTSGRARLALPRGLGRAGGRAAARRRPRLRAGRRALVPLDRLRRRQGPRHPQVERRLHVLRRRHRLRHREVQPRLRPPHLHLGRRPPRDGGPGAQRRRGDGLRPRGRPDAPHRLGPLRPRRRRGLDVQAGRRVHHARRAARRDRRRRRPLVLRLPRGTPRASTSTSSWRRSSRTRTRSTTSSTPTPGSPRSCARRPRPGLLPAAGVAPGSLGGDGSRPKARSPASLARFPEVVEDAAAAEETQGITAYATELATPFHAFYRDARVVDPAEPERSAARLALVGATQITLAERARPAGDLRARVDVGRRSAGAGRGPPRRPPRSAPRHRSASDHDDLGRRTTRTTVPGESPSPTTVRGRVDELGGVGRGVPGGSMTSRTRRPDRAGRPAGRRPSRRRPSLAGAPSTPSRAARSELELARACPRA